MNPPAARRPSTAHSIPGLLFALFSALMIALACGALWLLLYLALPGNLIGLGFALPLAVGVGLVIRHWVLPASWSAVALAALAMLLATAYMRVLLAVVHLAGPFGMSFVQTIQRAGLGMLTYLAWVSVGHRDLIVYAVAAGLAGATCWPRRPTA